MQCDNEYSRWCHWRPKLWSSAKVNMFCFYDSPCSASKYLNQIERWRDTSRLSVFVSFLLLLHFGNALFPHCFVVFNFNTRNSIDNFGWLKTAQTFQALAWVHCWLSAFSYLMTIFAQPTKCANLQLPETIRKLSWGHAPRSLSLSCVYKNMILLICNWFARWVGVADALETISHLHTWSHAIFRIQIVS